MIGAMNHRLSPLRSRYTDAGPEGPHPQPRTLDSHSEGVKPISGIVRPLSQRVLPDCACVCPLGPRSRAPGGGLVRPPSRAARHRGSSPCPSYGLLVEISRVEVRGICDLPVRVGPLEGRRGATDQPRFRREIRWRGQTRDALPAAIRRGTQTRTRARSRRARNVRSEASVDSPELAPTARPLRNRPRP